MKELPFQFVGWFYTRRIQGWDKGPHGHYAAQGYLKYDHPAYGSGYAIASLTGYGGKPGLYLWGGPQLGWLNAKRKS